MNLLKKNKVVFIASVMMVLVVGVVNVYQYISMSPKDVVEITPEYVGDATEFNFLVTDNLSYWTGKVVQIDGKVTELTEYGVVINGTIFCQFENGDDLQSIVENQQINIRGKLVGFDEILMEIKLNQCILP